MVELKEKRQDTVALPVSVQQPLLRSLTAAAESPPPTNTPYHHPTSHPSRCNIHDKTEANYSGHVFWLTAGCPGERWSESRSSAGDSAEYRHLQ